MVELQKTMFRAYDIRGQVNEKELSAEAMRFIAKGFAKMLWAKKVKQCVVGMDARPYNSELHKALVDGLVSSGIDVIDLGMVTTPMAYFAQWHSNVKGIAMITASHNPNGWSGLKVGYDKSSTFLPHDMEELYKIIQQEKFVEGKGRVEEKNIDKTYVEEIARKTKLKRSLRVVLNCRNGVAGKIAPKVLRAIGCNVIEQYCDVDDSYPHGVANPSLDAMLQELGDLVAKEKADLGIAIDADGDRIGAVDENGQMIYPDRMLVLLARNLLKSYPKSKIVFDVKSSQAVADDVKAHGGIPIMAMTGHSYIKQKVQETKAALGGERSGHMFFVKDWYGFDDACLAAARFLEYVSSESKRLSEIMRTVPKYYSSPVIHAPCPDEIKYDVLKKVVAFLKKKYPNVIDIDGAKVVFPDSWFLVRASSNLPVLVIGFEAKTKERLLELEQLVRKELANFPEIGKEWRNG
jgi:phosphomannomutase/phosphoglucomutase